MNNKKHISFPELAIEGIEQDKLIKLLGFIENETLNLTDAESFIWPYWKNPNKGNKIRMIISEKLDNWIFIYWSNHRDDDINEIMDKLIKFSNKRINYYLADSVTSHYKWIIANNGKITRNFYSCWNIEKNIGIPITNLEEDFIKSFENNEFVFGEDVFRSVYEKTCGLKLKNYTNITKFKTGIIEVNR